MSQIDFSKPRLQSFNGIFLIFLTDLANRVRQNFYLIAIPFLQNNVLKNYGTYIYIGIALLVVLQFVFSYLSYKKFRFSIQEDAFHLDHGVIKLSHVEIPFERIQNINLQQNILQQVFNVVGFEIETAGEGTAEIKIKALDREFASALKSKLIEEKEKISTEEDSAMKPEDKDNRSSQTQSQSKEDSLLFKLDFKTLIKVGVSSNLFKGVGLLLAFFAYLYNFVMDFIAQIYDLDLEEDFKDRIPETITFIGFLVLGVLIIGFLITIMSTVLKYYDLRILKNQNNYEVEYGLFKRINKVIKKAKTQIFEVRTNPIKNLLQIQSVYVSQASSNQLSEKQKITLVGLTNSNVELLFNSLYEVEYSNLKFDIFQSQKRLFLRYFYRNLFLIIGLSVAAYFLFFNWVSILILSLIFVVMIYRSVLKVLKSNIGFNQEMISIRKGALDTKYKIVEIYKLQSVRISRNIFQQYNGHADVIVETASGSITVEYLKLDEARQLLNYLIYKIESIDKDWI